jgi:L-seryl-tRNA(Ser) seleniumtransferase
VVLCVAQLTCPFYGPWDQRPEAPYDHAVGGTDPRRALPSVDAVLSALAGPAADLPHGLVVACARDAVDAARARIDAGDPFVATDADAPDPATENPLADAVMADAIARLEHVRGRLLRPVVNATGVLLHTNLGRAPIGEGALAAATAVGRGYANLEYRLDEGRRGSRDDHAGSLLAQACGAEAGLVVNNGAAAVLLVLAALARGGSVVVARGELVEIGGGFRIPEILAESGARLVEVGTTNRTRRADYERAVDDGTAAVLKVHTSNYRMVGFVASASVAELATLGPPVIVDAGSGLLDETAPWLPGGAPHWLRDEPGVRQCLTAGATLVTFSGDKLLGGPQAGIILGRADAVARVAAHPLARAVRADKLTLAALQDVALAYLAGDATRIPLWHMAQQSVESLRARAEEIARRVGARVKVVDTEAVAGGGALPGLTIPSVGVAVEVSPQSPQSGLARLRTAGVVARADERAVVCDLRTVHPADDEQLAVALAALVTPPAP